MKAVARSIAETAAAIAACVVVAAGVLFVVAAHLAVPVAAILGVIWLWRQVIG